MYGAIVEDLPRVANGIARMVGETLADRLRSLRDLQRPGGRRVWLPTIDTLVEAIGKALPFYRCMGNFHDLTSLHVEGYLVTSTGTIRVNRLVGVLRAAWRRSGVTA
jgi:hypothetical protein